MRHPRRLALGSKGLEAGVYRHQRLGIGADHPGIHEERGLIGTGLVAKSGQIADPVLVVHEHIGADLQFGKHAQLQINSVGARARSCDDGWRAPRLHQGSDHALKIDCAFLHSCLPLCEALDVLFSAAIELHASIGQVRRSCDHPHKGDSRLGGGDTGTANAWVDIDEHAQRLCKGGRLRQGRHIGRVVHHHRQAFTTVVQGDQSRDGTGRYHR